MLNETRLEGLILSSAETSVLALIDSQVILQLLVSKGIVTREEVAITRKIVSNQPKYKYILDRIDSGQNRVDENIKFEELFEKSLQPGGREQLTDDEKKYLIDRLDDYIKSCSKK